MSNYRNTGRFPYRVNLHSPELPKFKAEVLDLSEGGARVKVNQPTQELAKNSVFSFGAFLSPRVNSTFKGKARVAWVRETLDGLEAGIEWQDLTNSACRALRSALLKAAQ